MMKIATQLCLLTTLGLASGCNYYFSDGAEGLPNSSEERPYRVVADVFMSPIRDVDLLFVIDNSGSMRDEQESLAMWAEDSLFGVLKTRNLEQFNLHVAVVSTDMGAGPYGIMGCEGDGDGGRMQNQARFGDCPTPSDAYISNIAGAPGQRIANHEGTVAEAFACIAQLGTTGCGFEQTLESMKRALDGRNPGNAGFLRQDALLAVIIVTDEDDCSAQDVAVFDSDPGKGNVTSALGPLSSFRCFEHGVICDPDLPRTRGAHASCRSREDSQYIASVAGYAEFLRGLKADPSLLVVGGITGPSDTVWVGLTSQSEPTLELSCGNSGLASAAPAVRLREFFSSFPARNTQASICNASLERPLSQIAHRISDTANQSPCLFGEIADQDLEESGVQTDCLVTIELGEKVTELTSCASGAQPCYRIQLDLDQCSTTPSGLAVQIDQDSSPVAGAHIVVRCR